MVNRGYNMIGTYEKEMLEWMKRHISIDVDRWDNGFGNKLRVSLMHTDDNEKRTVISEDDDYLED
jgi:hypothetical protein